MEQGQKAAGDPRTPVQPHKDQEQIANGNGSTESHERNGETFPIIGLSPDFRQRYRLVKVLGQGGNGVVWLADDLALERPVAVKVPRRDKAKARQSVSATIAEARRVAGLNIGGIVPVFDVLPLDNDLAIIFKYIDGGSLADLLRRERVTAVQAARICLQAARTLAEAHLRDVIHRDIKPANILLDAAGTVWISDFGLATTEREQWVDRGYEVGTLTYMGPEQLSGNAHLVDARGDIYSLGVVLFELLTGRLPFSASDSVSYREAVLKRPPRAPRSICRDVPEPLEKICLRCLAKDPGKRYTTAADLASALADWLNSLDKLDGSVVLATGHLTGTASHGIASRETEHSRARFSWLSTTVVLVACSTLVSLVCVLTVALSNRNGSLAKLTQYRNPSATTGDWRSETAASNSSRGKGNIERRTNFSDKQIDDGGTLATTVATAINFKERELHWPGFLQPEPLRWFEDDKLLHVSSPGPRLIKCDPIDVANATIEVELRHADWRGISGIFFDYREETNDKSKLLVSSFEAVFIARQQLADGRSRLRLRCQRLEIDRTNGFTKPVVEHGFADVQWPGDANFAKLAVEIERYQLLSVLWNRQRLNTLGLATVGLPNADRGSDQPWKIWGLMHEAGVTQFRMPNIIKRTKP
jgi:serine/threonine protein kinase